MAYRSNFKRRKCCMCGSNETIQTYSGPLWHNHRCDNINCTKYLCHSCNWKNESQRRNEGLYIYGNHGKGLIGEAVIAKVRKLGIIGIKLDNFKSEFDLSFDYDYKYIQSKLRTSNYGDWTVDFGIEHNFDTLFSLCMNKYTKNIERIYAIPESELYGKQSIKITKIDSKWKKFRIDEKPYNNSYCDIMLYLGDKKYFNVEDIEKWLKMI